MELVTTVQFDRTFAIARVAWRIGLWNVFQVLRYRVALKLRLLRFEPRGAAGGEAVFFAPERSSSTPKPVVLTVFGWKEITFSAPPDWHRSVLCPDRRIDEKTSWSQALASVPPDVDVKEIWELSRFYWVPQLAREVHSGDADAAATLNLWLRDWEAENPPYQGINWSCGQEAGIRILHCAQAAIILDEVDKPQDALLRFVANSAARIAPTLHYALGQANNHGSAEAAALFVAGSWLERLNGDRRATHWKKLGRRWLENRAKVLILDDGCSNQYSTNYHRVVLDTYCFAEVWRRSMGEPPFSGELMSRMEKATHWLYQMTDERTGVAPAFGANDGSLLLSQMPRNHQDFRPSIQLGAILFAGALAYHSNEFDELMQLYGLPRPSRKIPAQFSQAFESGGYSILRRDGAAAILRFPNYRYRPSHADALHLDLHLAGKPVLFDGGTYSYAATELGDLSGVSSHNAVQFDGLDQMPRLSRFLYGNWLQTNVIKAPTPTGEHEFCSAAYTDFRGHSHKREVILSDAILIVKDALSGFTNGAILRWRLPDLEYSLDGNTLSLGDMLIHVGPARCISGMRIAPALHAPFYLKGEPCILLEILVSKPSDITTTIRF